MTSDMTSRFASVFRDDLFADRVVIVTGGGSGIGRCIAHELAALGAHVVIMGRTEAKLEAVAAEIAEDGGACTYTTCDIREEDQVRDAVAWVVARHGRIDGLVNNAGGQFPSSMEAMSTKGFNAVIRNNLVGTFTMMREVHNQAMKGRGGAIVNITAEHRNGFPTMAHTGASRAGVSNLTMTAAIEWGQDGVRVNEVAPGTTWSSGYDNYDPDFQAVFRGMAAGAPLGRLATESEVSAAVCFLLSDAAAFTTGASLWVDGGASKASHRLWPMAAHDGAPAFHAFHRGTTAPED